MGGLTLFLSMTEIWNSIFSSRSKLCFLYNISFFFFSLLLFFYLVCVMSRRVLSCFLSWSLYINKTLCERAHGLARLFGAVKKKCDNQNTFLSVSYSSLFWEDVIGWAKLDGKYNTSKKKTLREHIRSTSILLSELLNLAWNLLGDLHAYPI